MPKKPIKSTESEVRDVKSGSGYTSKPKKVKPTPKVRPKAVQASSEPPKKRQATPYRPPKKPALPLSGGTIYITDKVTEALVHNVSLRGEVRSIKTLYDAYVHAVKTAACSGCASKSKFRAMIQSVKTALSTAPEGDIQKIKKALNVDKLVFSGFTDKDGNMLER